MNLLAVVCMSGCVGYHRKPIVDRQVLHDLQSITLEGLGSPAKKPEERPPQVDGVAGLSVDDAVAVALHLNPDLRAFRKQRGIAEGELVSARLLPNPEIQLGALANLPSSALTVGSVTGAALVSPYRPGERASRVARAQAGIEQAKAQISAEEWRLAGEVRKAYLSLWALEEQLRIANASVRLQERILGFYRGKRNLGDASRLDFNLVNIGYTQALRQQEATTSDRDRGKEAFLDLLGLPPLYEFKMKTGSDPITYRRFEVDPKTLEPLMIERRPQLAAAKQEYEQAEQELHLAYIQRIPWFRLGPSYERESGGGEGTIGRLGLGIGLDLPIFNRNQGAIASLEANRDRLREGLTAKVHAARAELNEAYRNMRAQERLIRLYNDTIKPALDENTELTEAGFALGEFNLVQLITTQDKVLSSRREFVASELEYWKAAIDLETTVGAPLSEAQGVKP